MWSDKGGLRPAMKSEGNRMSDAEKLKAGWICDGCGSRETIDEIRDRNPKALSCCPERKLTNPKNLVGSTYSMILGAIISQRCKQKGYDQKDLLRNAGIATGSWSRIMRGKAHFQLEDMREVCIFFGWELGNLIQRADDTQHRLLTEDHVQPLPKRCSPYGVETINFTALRFLIERQRP